MPKRRSVEVYQGIKTVHSCRLYSEDTRKLFALPLRKGKITGVSVDGETVIITFEVVRHKYLNLKLGGK